MSDFGHIPIGRQPLDGVRIVAVEQYGAGPWATLQLACLGAEVIKIESPSHGDVGRYVPPFQVGEHSLFFEAFNGGKSSISLDLDNAAGRRVFDDLLRRSDGLLANLRGDTVRELRLRYDDLAPVNRQLVCCSLTGFGLTGPRSGDGALDYVIQGLAGWMSLTGEAEGPPSRSGLSLVDFSGGYVAALAMLAGLWRARRDGVGCQCDVSLYETALSLLTYVGTWAASRDYVPPRTANSAHPSIVPFQNFETADGVVVVACPKQEIWERFVQAIGRDDLLQQEAYADMQQRFENAGPLVETLGETLRTRSTHEWTEIFRIAGVPSGPIRDVREALDDDQVVARGLIQQYLHPELGEVRRIRSPLRLSGPSQDVTRAPFRGEHTRETLAHLCQIDDAEFAELESEGAFGPMRAAAPSGVGAS